ncbi:MAG: MFS transporter [Acuticoccus sp.]
MDFSFYRRNAWWLGTGLLLMFSSTFGQTYFISLFAGGIRETFDLTNGEWGGIYTIATIGSAALLIHIGRFADTMSLARLSVIILLFYAAAALLMMTAVHVVMLVVAIFGLRFCGQGMMTHLSMTAMARWFNANRGRAVAIAVLGLPLAEATLPSITVWAKDVLGWRAVWGIVVLVLLLLILPAVFMMLRHGRTPQNEGGGDNAVGMDGRHWSRRDVLHHWSFYALMPGILAPPFIGTCALFHQVHVADVRGYDLVTMTLAFPLYAAVSVTTSLLAGHIIDRFGPTRLLPFFLLPITIAIAFLAIPGGVWVWFVVMAGVGLSHGFAVTMTGSLWATLYGTRWIGGVKALFTAATVFATAAGPGITGVIIDEGINFPQQALYLSAYCLVVTGILAVLAPRLNAALARPAALAPA